MTPTSPPEFYSLGDLLSRYRCSKSWIKRRIERADFPKGSHIGGSKAVLWRRRDIEKWENDPRFHVPPPVNVGVVQ